MRTVNALRSNSLGAKEGRRGRDDQEFVQEGNSKGNKPSPWGSSQPGSCPLPVPSSPDPSTQHCPPGSKSSFEPTFLGFRMMGACLSSGLGGRGIKILAVGRIIKGLPVVNRA